MKGNTGMYGVKKAWCHVDMDGLNAIYDGQGWVSPDRTDTFYRSSVENSLALFEEENITATYFLIARDLDDPEKRKSIDAIVKAGHHIACHGLHHKYLNKVNSLTKREEIVVGKQKIEDALGLPCEGFRAPGYSIDFESLEFLREAGYRYDSSVFPNYTYRKRLGIQRLFPEPFMLYPEDFFFEVPMPYLGPGLLPFHPCYAFYLSRYYFRYCLNAFADEYNYFTLLFHLTDFSDRQEIPQNFRMKVFTNNFYGKRTKLAFLKDLIGTVRNRYAFTTTEDFLKRWPDSAPDLNPRTILGISTTHETGACLVRDGSIEAAINEERLSRKKLDTKYPPVQSIQEVIRIANIDPKEIDAVAIAGLHWKDLIPQSLESLRIDVKDFHSWNDYFPHFCRIMYRLFYFWRAVRYNRVQRFLEKTYGIKPKVYYVEHHEAHAASAYRTGTSSPALIVTADGVGDDVCITFSRGEGSLIRRLETFFYPNSFGQFYTACTQVLGFKGGRHEGKITGLSGFGSPNETLIQKVEKTFFAEEGFKLNKRYYAEGFIRPHFSNLKEFIRGKLSPLTVDYRNYKPTLKRLLKGYPREEVAYAFQYLLEREVVRLVRRHVAEERVPLVLAGGVFANVKLNMALSQAFRPSSLYIFPNMGDGGLCVGAALSIAAPAPKPVKHMYLGTAFSEPQVVSALEKYPDLYYTRPDSVAQAVAEALVEGRIVARFNGNMEFGPRALGNRSIMYHCGDPSVNNWLNHQLRRTEFMPFAPICLYEDADEYFNLRDGERRPCEFMTLVVDCTDKMKQLCPAAVHVDGTARPQLVRREVNREMYDILAAYKKLTGISCLINTSFNMHEEPIVRTPEEAITAFQQSKLDVLALGPFLVSQHVHHLSASNDRVMRGEDRLRSVLSESRQVI